MALTNSEIAQARRAQEELLPDLITIHRVTQEDDQQGGYIDTLTAAYVNIPCRIATSERFTVGRGSGERRVDRITEESDRILTLAHDQEISAKDIVQHHGTQYEVTGVNDGHSYRTARRVALKRIA
jgi:hypothetical protein